MILITYLEHVISTVALICLFLVCVLKLNSMRRDARFINRAGYVITCAAAFGHALGHGVNFWWPETWSYGDLSHTRTLLHAGVLMVFYAQISTHVSPFLPMAKQKGRDAVGVASGAFKHFEDDLEKQNEHYRR